MRHIRRPRVDAQNARCSQGRTPSDELVVGSAVLTPEIGDTCRCACVYMRLESCVHAWVWPCEMACDVMRNRIPCDMHRNMFPGIKPSAGLQVQIPNSGRAAITYHTGRASAITGNGRYWRPCAQDTRPLFCSPACKTANSTRIASDPRETTPCQEGKVPAGQGLHTIGCSHQGTRHLVPKLQPQI